jgi:hypothetical protein
MEVVFHRIFVNPQHTARLISAVVFLSAVFVFSDTFLETQTGVALADRDPLPEQYAAEYLASHLGPEDVILSLSPVDIQTAYYLHMNGVAYDVFYQRDHPVEIRNAVVVLRTNSKFNTPESVLDFYKITPDFDLNSARLLYEYGPVNVFSISAKSSN